MSCCTLAGMAPHADCASSCDALVAAKRSSHACAAAPAAVSPRVAGVLLGLTAATAAVVLLSGTLHTAVRRPAAAAYMPLDTGHDLQQELDELVAAQARQGLPHCNLRGGGATLLPFAGVALRSSHASPDALRAASPTVLAVVHPHWHGIRSAAYAQREALIEVPGVLARTHAEALLAFVESLPTVLTLVIHGIPPGTPQWAALLKQRLPRLQVVFVYHGAPSNTFHAHEASELAAVIDGARTGIVARVGLVKHGLAPSFAAMGVEAHTLLNFPQLPTALPFDRPSLFDGRVRIGVLGAGSNKNIVTQILGVCQLPGVIVHVIRQQAPPVAYLRHCRAEIVEHEYMPHDAFQRLLGAMDLNLYVSQSEAFPMVVLESLALGVPCLTSATHRIYAADEQLHQALVVDEFDNPSAITARVAALLPHLEPVGFRARGLLSSLLRQAQQAWDAFVRPPGVHVPPLRQLGSTGSVDTSYKPTQLLDAAAVASAVGTAGGSLAPAVVAFATYELAPVTPGGAGVVIAALAFDLVEAGTNVTVLAMVPPEDASSWLRYARDHLTAAAVDRLRVVVVPFPEADASASVTSAPSIYMQRAVAFAQAAQREYAAQPFDAIEFFDYAGSAYEVLRARRAAARSTLLTAVEADRSATAPRREYFPAHVPVALRLHGTIQLIHSWEGTPQADGTGGAGDAGTAISHNVRLMYAMETYALQTASVLLPQSAAMRLYYAGVYALDPARMVVAPPPMNRVLQTLDTALGLPSSSMVADGADALSQLMQACGGHEASHNCRIVLVLGKLQSVKGTELVAQAAQQLWVQRDTQPGSLPPFRVLFAGLDMPCQLHANDRTSQCITELLGPHAQLATVIPAISRSRVKLLVRTVRPVAAVIASQFETYGMAAHELRSFGVPLVVSDIPAFREHFRDQHMFAAGNVTALKQALQAALTSPSSPPQPLVYPQAAVLEPYWQLKPLTAAVEGVVLQQDLALTEDAIASSLRALALERLH